jgi:hypothetical protein
MVNPCKLLFFDDGGGLKAFHYILMIPLIIQTQTSGKVWLKIQNLFKNSKHQQAITLRLCQQICDVRDAKEL